MPAPVRRACISCVRAKRRCDLAIPSCYRCRVRASDCKYPNDAHPARRDRQQTEGPSSNADEQVAQPSLTSNTDDLPQGPDTGPPVAVDDDFQIATVAADEGSLAAFPDFNLDWPDIMHSLESYIIPDRFVQGMPSHAVWAGEVYQSRVVYAVARIKGYPQHFVTHGHTQFIHGCLYSEHPPSVIQDALAMCALYEAKNDSNQAAVFRAINDKANALVVESAIPAAWPSLTVQLANLQALVMYQIIRLFDGDIRMRADAERAEATLAAWTQQLQQHMQPATAESSTTSTPQDLSTVPTLEMSSYSSYILAESVRRTIIISRSVQGLYDFLKNGWDDASRHFAELSFYAQATLWEAQSEYAWKAAVREKDTLAVRFPTFERDLQHANPADVGELGVMMLALIWGIDRVEEWLGTGAPRLIETFGLGGTHRGIVC